MNDLGSLCLWCREDTSFGSGKFVNRIPAGTEEEEGYQCAECQTPELCEDCGKVPPMSLEMRCEPCFDEYERLWGTDA
jgi:hypothetical protein